MTDIVDAATRSRMMSKIRGKNTKPEKYVRSSLHSVGFRFRLHRKDLPGKPDIVLPKHNAAIFVNGCFWHGHDCSLFKWPKTRHEFWKEKITTNVVRDQRNQTELMKMGWRVCVVWECSFRSKTESEQHLAIYHLVNWLKSDSTFYEIKSPHRSPN